MRRRNAPRLSTTGRPAADARMGGDNPQLVRDLLRAFNDRQFADDADAFAEDAAITCPQSGEVISGLDSPLPDLLRTVGYAVAA